MFKTRQIEQLKDSIRAVLDDAHEVADKAEAENRDLTRSERKAVADKLAAANEMGEQRKALQKEQDSYDAATAQLADITRGAPDGRYPHGAKARGADWADAVARTSTDQFGRKSGLTPSGSILVNVPAPVVTPLGQPVNSLRSIIPSVSTAGAYTYLRQITRTNNAAPVADGAVKPTSVYETTLIERQAVTIAHISQPIQRQSLDDSANLTAFLSNEMVQGLEVAVENQLLNGLGTGAELEGLLHTSGVQTQAFSTSLLITTRKAVTKLEQQGLSGDAWVFNPADWEAVELQATSTGTLLTTEAGQAAPVDQAARRLWSRPVVTSNACAAGTAWYGAFRDSTQMWIREDAVLAWSENTWDPNGVSAGVGASDFSKNLLRLRVEGRFGFGVLRPSGVVKVALS
jgi:HK97 family phage major capsid protein